VTGLVEDLLAPWLPRQRWFAGKGDPAAAVDVRVVGTAELPADAAGGEHRVLVRVHLVRAAGALYQVPLAYHPAPVEEQAEALLGVLTVDGAARWVYDGPHDPLCVRALLRLTAREDSTGRETTAQDAVVLRGVRQWGGGAIDEAAASFVLRGEQSNTSVVIGADTPQALILKVFRVVHPGRNPDVVVQSALAAAGCTRVPQPAGWIEGDWREDGTDPDGDPDGEVRHGHLAFAVEFLGGSEDAWRVATRAVATGASFAGPAHDLGVATAEVHELLAERLPTQPMTAEALAELGAGLRRRVDWAVAQVPDLVPFADAARAAVDLTALPDDDGELRPILQQVHGDYHLGQVLHAPERGWVLLDFEGEPLRPLSERLVPDLALRDVAGMLRSFDYAAGFLIVSHPGPDVEQRAQAWAAEARQAFLAGYAERIGHDLGRQSALLHALELDKALYEVVYETRNRPDWVAIPWRAVRTLLGG